MNNNKAKAMGNNSSLLLHSILSAAAPSPLSSPIRSPHIIIIIIMASSLPHQDNLAL